MNAVPVSRRLKAGDWIRRLLIGWLGAVLICYLLLPTQKKSLDGLDCAAEVSVPLALGIALLIAAGLTLVGLRRQTDAAERWVLFALGGLCLVVSGCFNPRPAYLALGAVVLAVLLVYARKGRDGSEAPPMPVGGDGRCWLPLTWAAGLLVFLFLAGWGVARVRGLATPTFDFGLFAQMFERMRRTGAPVTTLERDGLLSHFAVHLSPIYYLLLPFYLIYPHPETLPVLQAALMVLALIPLWLLAREMGFAPLWRFLFCLLLLVFPAFLGGNSFDIHENAFLTVLLFWLFYSVRRKQLPLTLLFTLLVLAVKEDAAVYAAVLGLYLAVRGLLNGRADRWALWTGLGMLALALGWFLGATTLLRTRGDGVMNNRYENLMGSADGSLVSVVIRVAVCPMKGLYECVDPDKLRYLNHTLLPLLLLPLLTRKYERLLLLIPFFLVNLLSDYTYQHSIYFQYSFGSAAFLMLLVLLNLRDLLPRLRPALRTGAVLVPLLLCLLRTCIFVAPRAWHYTARAFRYQAECRVIREKLNRLPRDRVITASKYLTTPLYDCPEIYDWQFCSEAHVLESAYVAVGMGAFAEWGQAPEGPEEIAGRDALLDLLEAHGYVLTDEYGDWLRIYRAPWEPESGTSAK